MAAIHRTSYDPDAIARVLFTIARQARFDAPSWDGAGISIPVLSPGLGTIGRVLPGRGLYLADDLKNYGIKRRIPHVYERSLTMQLVDFFRDASYDKAEGAWRAAQRGCRAKIPTFVRDPERGAITTYNDIIAGRAGGKADDVTLDKTAITTVSAAWSSLWRAGGLPVAGAYSAIPGGSAPTKDTAGSWSFGLTNPTDPDKKYLLRPGFTSTSAINILMLVDLLVGLGNISATVTSSQTIGSTALTRYTTGAGVRVWLVVTTTLGTGTGTFSLTSYTDQDGNTAQAGQAAQSAASTIAERTLPNSGTFIGSFVPFAAGDYGIRAVSTFSFSVAHVTTGVVAMEIFFPLAFIPGVAANVWVQPDSTASIDGITELVTTSGGVLGCLKGFLMAGATSSGAMKLFFQTVAG